MRLSSGYQSTVADPFLFSHDGKVNIFYEVKTDFGVGEIHGAAINENGICEQYGCVLKESFHLSYPQVFLYENQVWMLPETASNKKVWLYRCVRFPYRWERERVLIDAEIVDPSLVIRNDGLYILGTTRQYELKLFHSPSLHQTFRDTGVSITKDKAISRNAGAPILIDGRLFRFAQNCQTTYGENINVLELTDLTESSYSETLVIRDLFKRKPKWMALGHHHISVAPTGNEFFVAIDGMRPDKLINNFTLAFLEACGS